MQVVILAKQLVHLAAIKLEAQRPQFSFIGVLSHIKAHNWFQMTI